MDLVLTIFFAFWIICSLLAQGDNPQILKYDYFILLPVCRFFCPTPVSEDISIYVQAKKDGEKIEQTWRPLFYIKKHPWCFIWHPEIRVSKSINTLARQLRPYMNSMGSIHLTSPYLSILSAAESLYKDKTEFKSIQFMLVSHSGFENQTRKVIFLSHVHNI